MKILSHLPENIRNVVTDSRRITPSQIADGATAFVAIRTKIGDGHKYIEDLYNRGLRTFVVDDASAFGHLDGATFVVAPAGTLKYLQDEAAARLHSSKARQIIITGSNKKTTAKELIAEAFRSRGIDAARSPRTWNSAMGIALSLFDNTASQHDVIITEVGIDAPGQAAKLGSMIRPQIGVITGITDEHDENFDSHADKIREKIALVSKAEKIVYLDNDTELRRQIEALSHPDAVPVSTLADLVTAVTGEPCPDIDISTRIEIRRAPDDCVLFIDSFTNDAASLPLSLALAAERRAGRRLIALLVDYKDDKTSARALTGEFGGETYFIDSKKDLESQIPTGLNSALLMIKGATPDFINLFDEARHDTTLQVDLDALVHNYNEYRRLLPPSTGLIGMVKADAYGLGALEVAKTLQTLGAAYLAVAVVDEGVALRKAGITMPILVLNPITNRFEALVEYNLEPAVFSLNELTRIENGIRPYAKTAVPIHIKFDTGMHRVGFDAVDISALVTHLRESRLLQPVSIFSHLATADCSDLNTYTEHQCALFADICSSMRYHFPNIKEHLLNTAGIETLSYKGLSFDLARLGIGLYGISASGLIQSKLHPVARLVSTIISIRHLNPSETVGYGCRGKVDRPSWIATLPIGYADGINRRLGNGAITFDIDGTPVPTIGNICMDLLMLDVTDAVNSGLEVRVGTEVEIFGPRVPVQRHADILGTIPYEILTWVSPRVRRSYHHR